MSIQLTVMSLDFETNVAPSTTTYTKKHITLGRGPDNDVILNLPEVSGKHAIIVAKTDDDGQPSLFIKDLGSSNGTLVENNYIESDTETPLLPNQRIKIGRFLIKPYLNKEEFDSLVDEVANGSAAKAEATEDTAASKTKSSPTIIMGMDRAGDSNGSIDSLDEHSHDETEDTAIALGQDDAGESSSIDDESSLSADDVAPATEDDDTDSVDFTAAETIPVGAKMPDISEDAEPETPEEEEEAAVTLPSHSDLSYGSVEGSVSDDDITDIDFVALQLFSVSGKVVHKGKPVEGVSVDAGELGSALTKEDGTFSFENVAETTPYDLSFSKDKYQFETAHSSGTVDSEISVSVDATRLFVISGRVVHRGEALQGVTIEGGSLGTTTTDADGRYEFTDVPEDTEYTLTAVKDGFVFGTRKVSR